jgi:predicted glycosyltransferase
MLLLDLNHPSDFHFFHGFMEKCRQHPSLKLLITARNRQYLPELLEHNGFEYTLKQGRKRTLRGKAMNLFREIFWMISLARKNKCRAFVSFASPYAAATGFFLRKPVITFDDTEDNKLIQLAYSCFSSLIITPECFEKDFGGKHLRFPGIKESSYLTPSFKLFPGVVGKYLDPPGQSFIIIRFVEHIATHEQNQRGISPEMKNRLVRELQPFGQVFITSDSDVPDSLRTFMPEYESQDMHQLMAHASLFIGESTTMAAEAAVLGTPSIVIEEKGRGYIRELAKKSGHLKWFTPAQEEEALAAAIHYLKTGKGFSGTRYSETTDIGSLLAWLFEDFEIRVEELKSNLKVPEWFAASPE